MAQRSLCQLETSTPTRTVAENQKTNIHVRAKHRGIAVRSKFYNLFFGKTKNKKTEFGADSLEADISWKR